jgi:hypothetical protein
MDIKGVFGFLDAMSAPESAQFAPNSGEAGYRALWIRKRLGASRSRMRGVSA